MNDKISFEGIERRAIDGTQIVPYVPVRIHAVFDLVNRLEGTVMVDTNCLRTSIIPGYTRSPESAIGSEGLQGVDTILSASSLGVGAAPGVLDVDVEVAVVLNVAITDDRVRQGTDYRNMDRCYSSESAQTVYLPLDYSFVGVSCLGMECGDSGEFAAFWTKKYARFNAIGVRTGSGYSNKKCNENWVDVSIVQPRKIGLTYAK